jgi:hypothetical protein
MYKNYVSSVHVVGIIIIIIIIMLKHIKSA